MPNKGDKVHVEFDAVYDSDSVEQSFAWVAASGLVSKVLADAVTVIAPTPETDPIGTVRKHWTGGHYVLVDYPEYPWVRLNHSHSVGEGAFRLTGYSHQGMAGSTVVGMVPGYGVSE